MIVKLENVHETYKSILETGFLGNLDIDTVMESFKIDVLKYCIYVAAEEKDISERGLGELNSRLDSNFTMELCQELKEKIQYSPSFLDEEPKSIKLVRGYDELMKSKCSFTKESYEEKLPIVVDFFEHLPNLFCMSNSTPTDEERTCRFTRRCQYFWGIWNGETLCHNNKISTFSPYDNVYRIKQYISIDSSKQFYVIPWSKLVLHPFNEKLLRDMSSKRIRVIMDISIPDEDLITVMRWAGWLEFKSLLDDLIASGYVISEDIIVKTFKKRIDSIIKKLLIEKYQGTISTETFELILDEIVPADPEFEKAISCCRDDLPNQLALNCLPYIKQAENYRKVVKMVNEVPNYEILHETYTWTRDILRPYMLPLINKLPAEDKLKFLEEHPF